MAIYVIAALLFTADQATAFRAVDQEVAKDSLQPWNPTTNYKSKGGFPGFCHVHCEPDDSGCILKNRPTNWPKENRRPVDATVLRRHCGSCIRLGADCVYQVEEPVIVKEDVVDHAGSVATVVNGGEGLADDDGDDDDTDDKVIESLKEPALNQSPKVTVKAQEAADECLKVLDKTDFNGDKVDMCCRTHWTSTLVSDLHGCVRSVLWHHYGKVVHHGRIVDKEEANHGFHKPEAHPETAKSQAPVVPEWTKTKLRHFEKEPDVPQPVVEAGPFAKFGAKKPQHVEPKNEPKVSQPSLSDAPVVTDAFAKFGAKKPQHVEPKGSQPSLSDDSVKADAFAKFGAKKRHVENKPEVPQPSLSDAPVVTDAFAKFGAERRPKSEPLADFVQPSGNSVKPESPGGPTGVKELRERFQRK